MAFPSASTAIFVLFLISAALVLPSQADVVSIVGLEVAGRLFCSVDGNSCPNCAGLAGVNVTITCNDSTTSLGSVLTDTNGFFSGVLSVTDEVLSGNHLFPCFATVQLPVANCALLPQTGILQAEMTVTGINSFMELIFRSVPGLFLLVATVQ